MHLTYDEIIAVAQKTRTAESQNGDYVLPLSFANEIVAANDARAATSSPRAATTEEFWPALPPSDGEISGVRYWNLYTLREYCRTLLAQAPASTTIPAGYALAPIEPTPEIMAAAAMASWPPASPADIDLARKAAPIVLMQLDAAPGVTLEMMAAMLSTMAPAYRAMIAAAAAAAPTQAEG